MQRRTDSVMRFWRRKKSRRVADLAQLLIELEQLAHGGRAHRRRASLHF
jgi:hypothetical protein